MKWKARCSFLPIVAIIITFSAFCCADTDQLRQTAVFSPQKSSSTVYSSSSSSNSASDEQIIPSAPSSSIRHQNYNNVASSFESAHGHYQPKTFSSYNSNAAQNFVGFGGSGDSASSATFSNGVQVSESIFLVFKRRKNLHKVLISFLFLLSSFHPFLVSELVAVKVAAVVKVAVAEVTGSEEIRFNLNNRFNNNGLRIPRVNNTHIITSTIPKKLLVIKKVGFPVLEDWKD